MSGLEKVVNSGSLRFIVIDGSTVQEPGATATTYRLHVAIDLINLSIRQIEVTTDKVGESLNHYQLDESDVVLLDRGYNQPKTLIPFLDRGGDVVLRYNAHSMNLYETDTTEQGKGRLVRVDWESRLQTLAVSGTLFTRKIIVRRRYRQDCTPMLAASDPHDGYPTPSHGLAFMA